MDFLKLKIQNPEEMKGYFPQFLKEWGNFYPDQLKTHVDTIAYSKKISKLEAIKLLEGEITEQFNKLVDIYQSFSDPFKIYSFWEAQKNIEKGIRVTRPYDSDVWVWCLDSEYPFEVLPFEENNPKTIYQITGLAFKKDVDWKVTILKNCELTIGFDEKEIVLFRGTKIKIVEIKENNF